jgi:hypothetical protein
LLWLQSPTPTNGDNPNNKRHETSRTFRREYLKELMSLEQTVRTKIYTNIEAFNLRRVINLELS